MFSRFVATLNESFAHKLDEILGMYPRLVAHLEKLMNFDR